MRTFFWIAVFLAVAPAMSGCAPESSRSKDPDRNRDFRQDMMEFVAALGAWARTQDANFIVIPQNGQDVYSDDDAAGDPINPEYFDSIDGTGREDLFYGYDADNSPTDTSTTARMRSFLDVYAASGKVALVTDYIDTTAGAADSYGKNLAAGYVGFAADRRALDSIPATLNAAPPNNYPNTGDVTSLAQVHNFLYIINPAQYATRSAFLSAVNLTEFDLVIVDAFDNLGQPLSPSDVTSLRIKSNGHARLAVSYMSIGEAEDYRYYWNPDWKPGAPSWLDKTNPAWEGNYKVRYWDSAWQSIIFGNDDSYLQRILDAGFDGVYLDIIDAFEYWESKFG